MKKSNLDQLVWHYSRDGILLDAHFELAPREQRFMRAFSEFLMEEDNIRAWLGLQGLILRQIAHDHGLHPPVRCHLTITSDNKRIVLRSLPVAWKRYAENAEPDKKQVID